jgi:hypothetical protein
MKNVRGAFLVMLVILAVFSSVFAHAGNSDVRFEGPIMKFPTADGRPDADLSQTHFDLQAVPPEVQFMVGKVFKGQFVKTTRQRNLGAIWYAFLTEWNQQIALSVYAWNPWNPGKGNLRYKVVCPANALASGDFVCTNGFSNWKFYIRKQKPTFLASDGQEIELDEVATLPREIMAQ